MSRWRKKLDVSDVFRGDAPFAERRDEMVRRVRALDPHDNDGELQDIADELADAQDGDEWDGPWDLFYDWADATGVWVVTR
jgi:hypothetical protein